MKILNISLATTFALITTLFGNHLAYADKSLGYEKAKKKKSGKFSSLSLMSSNPIPLDAYERPIFAKS